MGNGFYTVYYKTDGDTTEWKSINRATALQLSGGVKEFVDNRINPESTILPRDVKKSLN